MKQEYKKIQFSKYLFLALTLLYLFVAACTQPEKSIANNQISSAVVNVQETGSVKTFVLTGENFKFLMDGKVNPDLEVSLGDTVRVEFTSTQGFHDWVVDGFNAATEMVRVGNTSFAEFKADKKGTFEYYCSIGSHRVSGMKGKLVVE